jgi:aspartate/glutamate racemase
MKRIALIHALQHSIEPINSAFARDWPEAVRVNILDDSLSADLARNGGVLDDAMHARFETIADYAVNTGADGILFTCSAFGPSIERVAIKHQKIPVLKPNEAMIAEAAALGGALGLIASFAPTLVSMPPEFPVGTDLRTALVADAMDALNRGDMAHHDALIVAASRQLAAQGAQVIALAQFSMARAASAVAAATGLTVLTTPESGIRLLRARLNA